MNFPVFSQLAGNFRVSETGSLQTASSSGESTNFRFLSRRRASQLVQLRLFKDHPGQVAARMGKTGDVGFCQRVEINCPEHDRVDRAAVAVIAAFTWGAWPPVTITSTSRRANSPTAAARRSRSLSWTKSIVMLRPST